MNILVVDDNRHRIAFFKNAFRQHKITVCGHARAAIKALRHDTFDVIFLDHDLEGRDADPEYDNTGSEIARFIADHLPDCGRIILHTENPDGRASMEAILPHCESIPYGKLKKVNLHTLLKYPVSDDGHAESS